MKKILLVVVSLSLLGCVPTARELKATTPLLVRDLEANYQCLYRSMLEDLDPGGFMAPRSVHAMDSVNGIAFIKRGSFLIQVKRISEIKSQVATYRKPALGTGSVFDDMLDTAIGDCVEGAEPVQKAKAIDRKLN